MTGFTGGGWGGGDQPNNCEWVLNSECNFIFKGVY